MSLPINLDRLRWPSRLVNGRAVDGRPDVQSLPRHRQGEPFLKGPIPLGWWVESVRLPGHAQTVGHWLWYLAGKRTSAAVRRGGEPVNEIPVSLHAAAARLSVDRMALSRGLRALERARLVAVRRHPGRKLIVTLLDSHCSALAEEAR